MNQIKRQLNFSRPSDKPIKKLRTNICLEDLSNELFYEMFDYLDGYDIHQAFSNLNIRFRNLLTNSLLPLKVNLSSKSQPTLEHRCRQFIIPNRHRILSLHLNNDLLIHCFFSQCNIDSSFNRLESVVLNGVSDYKIMMILFYLNSLPRLFSLTIQLEEDSYYNISDIYRIVFRLPYLKYTKLSISDYEEPDIFIPMSINEKPSSIEHLVLNHRCNLRELTSILQHTSHLQHLTCDQLVEMDVINGNEAQLTLPQLTHISIDNCDIAFDKFELFMKKITSQLQVLRLKTSSNIAYLDGDRWKRLIKKHIPLLSEFHFDYHACADNFDNMTPNHESINQFTSAFWTDRCWFFELKDTIEEVVYSIHPCRKTWFNYHDYEQTTACSDGITNQYTTKSGNTSRQEQFKKAFIPSIQLTIEGYTTDAWDPLYIDEMKLCFSVVPFTHLNIDSDGLPLGILVDIIRLLPNLDSLKVSSLPLVQLSNLSSEDTEMILLVSITSKITKVKLDKMGEIEQVHFLMNLCPRMQYLQIGCTTENDLENIMGSISINNITRIPYLCCLCLNIPNANEKMMRNLDKIIDFERLFHNDKTYRDYMVRRVQNKIYLNWKL